MEQMVGSFEVKKGLAQMLKGGVIMDVVNADHAKIAEDAGACAVMALERVPADIRADGGVARMSDPDLISGIIDTVSIPVMAKARIGHFVEAQVLQQLGVDYIDESEVLSPADYAHHIDKHAFTVPFVCGATNLGEALRRITEGASMIRSKGEYGSCQLHMEFQTPTPVEGEGQGRGNSGVFLMGQYEVQVLDNYENTTYPDGQAGALYGRKPPLVNACRLYGVDPESALERTNKKFIQRFNYMEERAAAKGHTLHEMSLGAMEELWQEAKRN